MEAQSHSESNTTSSSINDEPKKGILLGYIFDFVKQNILQTFYLFLVDLQRHRALTQATAVAWIFFLEFTVLNLRVNL